MNIRTLLRSRNFRIFLLILIVFLIYTKANNEIRAGKIRKLGLKGKFAYRGILGFIKLLDLETGRIRNLWIKGFDPSLSGDENKLAYSTTQYIYWYDFSKKRKYKILKGKYQGAVRYPSWSPSGKLIGYWANRYAEKRQFPICLYDIESGIEKVIVDSADSFTWSSDGSKIMYSVDGLVRIIDMNTKVVEELPEEIKLYSPQWSPSGEWVVGLEYVTGHTRELVLLNPERKEVRNISPLLGYAKQWRILSAYWCTNDYIIFEIYFMDLPVPGFLWGIDREGNTIFKLRILW